VVKIYRQKQVFHPFIVTVASSLLSLVVNNVFAQITCIAPSYAYVSLSLLKIGFDLR
jgi:hypothetical protein